MDRGRELEQLIIQRAELVEQRRSKGNDLESILQTAYLTQQINEIEDSLSLCAFLFTRES